MKKPQLFFWICLFVACSAYSAETNQLCNNAPWPTDFESVGFKHKRNSLVSFFSSPAHVAPDALGVWQEDATVFGFFAYGLWKPLFDEDVEIWLDDCRGNVKRVALNHTDMDGQSWTKIAASEFSHAGQYQVYQRVPGDNSVLRTTLRVIPRDTHLTIFDIDGTLTDAMVSDTARPGAASATWTHYNDLKREIVYLSSRHYVLAGRTRWWLKQQDMAPGTFIFGLSLKDWPATESGAGDYKIRQLRQLIFKGFVIDAAYGDQLSDIYAYDEAGIDKRRTYILGAHGGKSQTVALGTNYLTHIKDLVLRAN